MVPLPPYARRVEYLESTGTQWIDTGIVPNPQTEIRLRATVTQTAGRGLVYTYPQSESSELRIFFNLGGSTFYYDRGSARLQYGTTVRNLDLVATNYALYLSGTRVASGTTQQWTGTTSLRVFSTIVYAGKYDLMRLRALQILDGSTHVRSFVPCRILDVGYLWDEVEGKFYGNQGTGDFVLGPDVREGVVPTRLNPFGVGRRQEEIRRVEYLESTGTQSINTGVVLTPAHRIEADFEFTQVSTKQQRVFEQYDRSGHLFVALYINGAGNIGYAWSQTVGGWKSVSKAISAARRKYVLDGPNRLLRVGATTATLPLVENTGPGEATVMLGSKDTSGVKPTYGKWYSAKIYNGDVLVRDFVPVAIGSTGYLLDMVSGRLFGNSGTGAFGVGPDFVPHLRVWGTGRVRRFSTFPRPTRLRPATR